MKALLEVIQEIRRIGTEEQAERGVAALVELAAIERALAVGHRVIAGDLHVVPRDRLNEACALMHRAHEAELAREDV